MKKLIFFIIAVATLAACSKKSTIAPTPQLTPQNATLANLTGDWLLVVDTTYVTTNNQSTYTTSGNNADYKWLFNADGSGTVTAQKTPTTTFTCTVTNGVITLHNAVSAGNPAQDLSVTILAITNDKLALALYIANTRQDMYFTKD